VRAHTDLGSDLILTPLRAAMAEIDGLQVHRSWWVARSAVTAALVDGRKHSLRLTNGLDVPVSRASVAKLRALGWL
jgi:DNA-binding LytR/AlgR family response regulator